MSTNPVPGFTSSNDVEVPVGSSSRTLNFAVFGLASTGYMTLNGSPRSTKLTTLNNAAVTFPSADFAKAGTYTLRLFNPTPGGGTSTNSLNLVVNTSTTSCPAPTTSQTINLCAPASTTSSPSRVLAIAYATGGVKLIQVYVDGLKRYEVAGAKVDTTLSLASGTRRLTIQAQDAAGVWFKKVVYVTVQ